MASHREYLEYVLEQLSGLEGVSYRAMMDEYILYYHGKVVGGIYDDRFLVKPVKAAEALMPDAPRELPYEGAKEMLLVQETDDRAFMERLLEAMEPELPEPKKKKKAAEKKGILETERLILRPWQEADAEECFRYASDPAVGPIAGWPVHTSVEMSREVIRDILMVPETYAVVWKESGLPIGSVSLHFHSDLAQKEDECELGYWLGAPYWGKGFMTEAAREMLRHAFEDLGVSRVWAGYYDGNDRSRRVQEKCGFRYQRTNEAAEVPQMNEVRTGHVNRLTREEWARIKEGGPSR